MSGPYRATSEWQLERHIQAARDAALRLWVDGWAVITPHMNTAHLGGACPDDVWLSGYLEIMRRCDAVYMLENWQQSRGARAELDEATRLDMPVLYQKCSEIKPLKVIDEPFNIEDTG